MYHNSRFCDRNRLLEKEKKGGGGAKIEVEKESSELIKSENLVIFCIIELFSIFSTTINITRKSELTKELCVDVCEEVQVVGNIVCHGRWKRFHHGVKRRILMEETAYTKEVPQLLVL